MAATDATVDGTVVAPDKYGVIQGNGGAVDKMSGGTGNDYLQGHAKFNQFHGGDGNDTFILNPKFSQMTTDATKTFSQQSAYITDFQGAGNTPYNEDHDSIAFSGFGAGSTLEILGSSNSSSTSPAKVYYYAIHDSTTGQYYNFTVNSLNGKALEASDYHFYPAAASA